MKNNNVLENEKILIQKNPQEEKPEEIWKKVTRIVLNVLFYIFIIFLLVFSIGNLRSQDNNIPNMFGTGYMNVLTGSMTTQEGVEPNEDSFEVGDMIFVKMPNEKRIDALEIGDIVTFVYPVSQTNASNIYGNTANLDEIGEINITHRIVDITTNSNGDTVYIAQGDYYKDQTQEYSRDGDAAVYADYIQTFDQSKIKGIYSGQWNNAGNTLKFLQSSLGFGLCIVLPTFLLLVFEAVLLVRNILKNNREKMAAQMEENKIDLEAEREKMKQELLNEMKAKKSSLEEKKETKDSSSKKSE